MGTAVCGNSAVAAAAPIVNASEQEVSFAVAVNTLFGSLAIFFYPLIGQFLGLSDVFFGTWAGTAINDTSQVVAAAFAFSIPAGEIATTIKLTRNSLMAFVLLLIAFLSRRGEKGAVQDRIATTATSIPGFILGFLFLAALNSLGFLNWSSQTSGIDVALRLEWAARFLILFALAGIGLNTCFSTLRALGIKALYVGLAAAATTSIASLLLIKFIGPASR